MDLKLTVMESPQWTKIFDLCEMLQITMKIKGATWKCENVAEVQRRLRREGQTDPSTRLTITRIRDKFETSELFKTFIKGVLEDHDRPSISHEKQSCWKVSIGLQENLFGKQPVKQEFQNRASIAC
ncbi:uncharacterized protein LOC143224667 [Tachypleus tridentatus]|uniref:uncharacterized protein LOC143224667 n=1 Tax=Tachypleus tridentatus TaxID=6853 RepID=UPI003FD54C0F